MTKIYSKAELFDKSMTLAKLQKIATQKGVAFEGDNSKATIANLILKKQMDEALTTPDSPEAVMTGEKLGNAVDEAGGFGTTVDAPAPGVDDKTANEIAAENEAASKADQNGVGGSTDPRPPIPADVVEELRERLGLNEKVNVLTDELLEAIKNRLGTDAIAERVRNIERFVDGQRAKSKDDKTLHGSIDNLPNIDDLPKPGRIDDLPKIG